MTKIINNRYQKLNKIGQGGYACVYRSIDTKPHLQDKASKFQHISPPTLLGYNQNSSLFQNMQKDVLLTAPEEQNKDQKQHYSSSSTTQVALKKIKKSCCNIQGVDFTLLREIKYLGDLKHDNIIRLYDIFTHKFSVYLALQYARTDLDQLIKTKSLIFEERDIRGIFKQVLNGISFMHSNFVMHRDLKPSNLLICNSGLIKCADFGMARRFGTPREFTKGVVTLWYRAPQLLYGASYYGNMVDMWSVGCIFMEVLIRQPVFPGTSEIDQLSKIFAVLGVANEENWPGVSALKNYLPFESVQIRPIQSLLKAYNPKLIDLIQKLLVLDPNKRLTADQALDHPFFKSDASTPEELSFKFLVDK